VPEHVRSPRRNEPAHYGAAGTGVVFAEATIASAYNVQGDAARGSFRDEVRTRFGVELPGVANAVEKSDAATALWLGPRSWLLLLPTPRPPAELTACRDALNAVSGALFDMSASRIAWTIRGTDAEAALAKSCPLDFDRRAFAPRTCAQSLLGRVSALFVRDDDGFTVLVARSFARDVWHGLCTSAAQYGYEVLASAP
jgi:heterotetrameric sarcosine oxidase gamma subunit